LIDIQHRLLGAESMITVRYLGSAVLIGHHTPFNLAAI